NNGNPSILEAVHSVQDTLNTLMTPLLLRPGDCPWEFVHAAALRRTDSIGIVLNAENRGVESQASCFPTPQSARRATIGSTFVARRAGTYEASVATAPNISDTVMKVVGSSGAMP